jgi:hypothetical protein
MLMTHATIKAAATITEIALEADVVAGRFAPVDVRRAEEIDPAARFDDEPVASFVCDITTRRPPGAEMMAHVYERRSKAERSVEHEPRKWDGSGGTSYHRVLMTSPSGADETRRNLVSIRPSFIVKDLQASMDHYVERFGFQRDFSGPEGGPFWGQVSRGEAAIIFKAVGPDVPPVPNHTRHEWARWDAYIYTVDPAALFVEFRQRGVSFRKELSFIDDGLWGFEVTDADGYVVAFFRSHDDHRSASETSSNLESVSPFFIVKDLQASIDFYIERFGFQRDFTGPEGGAFYGQVSRDGIAIFLKKIGRDVLPVPHHTRHEWGPWDAYIYTLDPDALFADFRQRGVSFRKELSFLEPGLWGFEVRDADGYSLAFFRLRNGGG